MLRPRIVLVRHAETDLNAQDRYQARLDVPLNAVGAAQAEAAAAALRADRWAGVWSSPARRAVATASPLADALGTLHRELPDLLERDLGALDGMSRAAHRRTDPLQAAQLVTDPAYAPAGGESLADVLSRLCRALAHIVATTPTELGPGRPMLVVTHGGVINALAAHLLRGRSGGARPVGNARAAGLELSGLGVAGASVSGSAHHWNVPPHTGEGRWPAARPRVLPWAVATPVPTTRREVQGA